MSIRQLEAVAYAKMALAHTVAGQGPQPRPYILEGSPEQWETIEAEALRSLIAAFPQPDDESGEDTNS
jgi:hypothetical protein